MGLHCPGIPGCVDHYASVQRFSFASFLHHICIDFPAFDDYHHLESVTLKEDSIRTLERIRDNCTNLATLETSLRFRTINIMESAIDAPDSPRAAALALVDARFKAISSLKEIVVKCIRGTH